MEGHPQAETNIRMSSRCRGEGTMLTNPAPLATAADLKQAFGRFHLERGRR